MRKFTLIVAACIAASIFTACGGPATNAPASNANTNTNTNTAKPVAAAPTADSLLAKEKEATEAYLKGDPKYFDGFLADKFMMLDEHNKPQGKAAMLKMIPEQKCDTKDIQLTEQQLTMVDADTYVLVYKSAVKGTCTGPDGKSMEIPSPMRAATVYVRSGAEWKGAFHGENLIIDPKNPPPAPPKPAAKKDEPKKDDKMAANSAASAPAANALTADANTDALVKIHTSGWDAFKAKDAKKFDEITSANLVNVNPIGTVFSGKANVIKEWTETMKCEGITKVGVSDGLAVALSPTVELFTLKGSADGTCDGQKNGPLYQTTLYMKEGDAWKLAFMFESPGM
ncbi:hypothetical protein BH10ACI2_BH10ACI2_11480 [soil metagenome]